MITNPRECWMYCIQTESLREPSESYELLKHMRNNPTLSIKEAADDMGVDYDKARTWSSKYFYKSRLKSYTRDMNDKITTALTNLKLQQVDDEIKKDKIERSILSNELYFVQKEQMQMVELEKKGKLIPDYLRESVEEKEKKYFNNKLNKRRSDKIIWDSIREPAAVDEVAETVTEETPEIKSFLKAMQANRNARSEK